MGIILSVIAGIIVGMASTEGPIVPVSINQQATPLELLDTVLDKLLLVNHVQCESANNSDGKGDDGEEDEEAEDIYVSVDKVYSRPVTMSGGICTAVDEELDQEAVPDAAEPVRSYGGSQHDALVLAGGVVFGTCGDGGEVHASCGRADDGIGDDHDAERPAMRPRWPAVTFRQADQEAGGGS